MLELTARGKDTYNCGRSWEIVDKSGDKWLSLWIATRPAANMFIGEYQHAVDTKARLAIPAKFRDELSQGGVLTRGLDHCLFLFTRTQWAELAEKLRQLPLSQANSRAFARLMLSGASEVALDAQGRILVPVFLRDYAKLGAQVIVAGLLNRIEIWDLREWKLYKTKAEKDSADIAEKMGSLGI